MARILADYENLAMATNDLAFVAHLLDRRTYLHNCFLSVFLHVTRIYHGQPLPMIFVGWIAQTDVLPLCPPDQGLELAHSRASRSQDVRALLAWDYLKR